MQLEQAVGLDQGDWPHQCRTRGASRPALYVALREFRKWNFLRHGADSGKGREL